MVAHEQLALGGVYGALGTALALLARAQVLPYDAARVLLALFWLGFVLAISFLEAWVKFRAPFVPRHLNLDVGRKVFAALNAVELALCTGLWLVQLIGARSFAPFDGSIEIIVLTVVLGTQLAVLFPKLQLSGDYALYDALKDQHDVKNLTFHQKSLLSDIRKRVQANAKPSRVYHIAYVLGEVAKVVLLAVFSLRILNTLPQ